MINLGMPDSFNYPQTEISIFVCIINKDLKCACRNIYFFKQPGSVKTNFLFIILKVMFNYYLKNMLFILIFMFSAKDNGLKVYQLFPEKGKHVFLF